SREVERHLHDVGEIHVGRLQDRGDIHHRLPALAAEIGRQNTIGCLSNLSGNMQDSTARATLDAVCVDAPIGFENRRGIVSLVHGNSSMPNLRTSSANNPKQTVVITML